MQDGDTSSTNGFPDAFRRPIWIVMMVCQMLLGLGLAIALVLKVYMLIFSDQVCTPDSSALGNAIRCVPTLEMLGHFLVVVAGFRLAALFFVPHLRNALEPLFLSLAGSFLLYLSGLIDAAPNWQAALTIVALMAAMATIYAAQHRFPASDRH